MPILMTIHFIQEPLSQQEIANLLQKDKAGVQRSIQTMRKGGFLHIEDDPHDKRRNIVSLTTSGRFACEKAIECVQEFDARLKSQLTEQESELISKVLDKLLTIVND
nr:MarR family transcriptional regulator [Rhabdobacter roseus]